jgi:hypothetical protein
MAVTLWRKEFVEAFLVGYQKNQAVRQDSALAPCQGGLQLSLPSNGLARDLQPEAQIEREESTKNKT